MKRGKVSTGPAYVGRRSPALKAAKKETSMGKAGAKAFRHGGGGRREGRGVRAARKIGRSTTIRKSVGEEKGKG